MRRGLIVALVLVGCGGLDGGFTAEPGAIEQGAWASTELTLRGFAPRIVFDRSGDGVVVRGDLTARLGDVPLDLADASGPRAALRLTAAPPLGSFPVTLTNRDGEFVSANEVAVLAVLEDGGLALADGGVRTPSAASEVAHLDLEGQCEREPVLTHDLRYLLVARPWGRCAGLRSYRVFEWNDGDPIDTGATVDAGFAFAPSSGHPLDGALVGHPGEYAVVYADTAGFGPTELRIGFLTGSPPTASTEMMTTLREGTSPTLTADGETMVFLEDGAPMELEEPLSNPDGDPRPMTELLGEDIADPAISPDGLTLVYSARVAAGEDRELFLARRADADLPFETPAPLPHGATGVNSDADEHDPFLTSDGQLLFTSDRDGGERRVYSASL